MSDPLRDTENPMVQDHLWRWEERLHDPEEESNPLEPDYDEYDKELRENA